MPTRTALTFRTLAALLLGGCNLSPLQNRIAVGEDAFVAFAGVGSDGASDIFAGLPSGGDLSRITFTPVDESHPALTRRGEMIAFVRHPPPTATATPTIVVMNLLNGAERRIETTITGGGVEALGWSADEQALLVRGSGLTWEVPFPASRGHPVRLEGARRAAADSLLDQFLGRPVFARADACDGGGVCVVGPSGVPTVLSTTGHGPFRWGDDSVAWFEDDRLMVRPLGPGAARTITWRSMPREMRQGSYASTRDDRR